MTMNRVRCVWSNFPGAPGYSNFYVGTGITDHTPIRTFWGAVGVYMPSGLTITVPTSGDQISEATGQVTGAYTATVTGGSVAGTGGSGNYSGTSGAVVEWLTSAIIEGRRPMGKTYIVPGYNTLYDTNGTLASTAITAITSAATTLIAAFGGELKVWSRPRPSIAGANVTVIASRVPDTAVILRSRRV